MKATALRIPVLLLLCGLAAGCTGTFRVRPGLDDLYLYEPGDSEHRLRAEATVAYAAGAAGRRLRVESQDGGIVLKVRPGEKPKEAGKPWQAEVVVMARRQAPKPSQQEVQEIVERFETFWTDQVDKLEGTLTVAGKATLVEAIRAAGPRTFLQSLEAGLGLHINDIGRLQVDLLAGMRLRIETAVYQRPPGTDGLELGYVNVGQAFYSVITRADGKLAFEPFLGLLNQMDAGLEVDRGTRAWYLAGSIADLHMAGKSFNHYRLIYPTEFPGSQLDTLAILQKVVLVGADSKGDLSWSPGDDQEHEETCSDEGICRFVTRFRGRALVIPEIPVILNGNSVWVSVGTTLRNIAEPFRSLDRSNHRGAVKLYRRSNGEYTAVFLASKPAGTLDPLNLPLLPGDRIVLRGGY